MTTILGHELAPSPAPVVPVVSASTNVGSSATSTQTLTVYPRPYAHPVRYLVTGGAGFVGSHLVRHLLANTDAHLVLPVTFRHRGSADRLVTAIQDHPDWQDRLTLIYHDLRGPFSNTQLHKIGQCEVIVNVASESHVDRSIIDPVGFIRNNVDLMLTMLELARKIQPRLFIQVSTDEVYGPARDDELHAEWSTIVPSNPYSASKAMQEAACISFWRTYGVPVVITNTMNIIGETQDREKWVPLLIHAARDGLTVKVHTDPDGRPGSRFYLHARNQADALLFVIQNVQPQLYPTFDRPTRLNVVGDVEIDNMQLSQLVNDLVCKHRYGAPGLRAEGVSFHESRPGHDLRYALDGALLASLGWKAPVQFAESLERTVRWTLEHPQWLL